MSGDAKWRYFGCGNESGHYLFDPHRGRFWPQHGTIDKRLGNMDGILPPFPEPGKLDYRASFNRLGGLGYSALSWWDRTVDKRSASNSTLFAPSLTITAEEMLAEGPRWFPWVFKRLPQPLILIGDPA